VDVRFSAIASFGSGQFTNVLDFTQGFSLANREATHPFSPLDHATQEGRLGRSQRRP